MVSEAHGAIRKLDTSNLYEVGTVKDDDLVTFGHVFFLERDMFCDLLILYYSLC